MKVTKSRLKQIIKEEVLKEIIGAPEGLEDDTYSFHDPENIHMTERLELFRVLVVVVPDFARRNGLHQENGLAVHPLLDQYRAYG